MAEQTVELQPGESEVVTFEAIPHEARTYHVSVNGLTGSFRAMECSPGEEECREADLYVCSNKGLWELAEKNSPQCLTPLGRVLAEIEAGTWTATTEQLAKFEEEVGRGTDYDTAINAACNKAAKEAEAIGGYVIYSPEEGYYASPTEWVDGPPWEDIPWEDIPWDDWPNWWDGPPWEDIPWDDWANWPWENY